MSAADVVVFVGMGALIAGVCGAFGWPYAAMVGGLLLILGGAKMTRAEAQTPQEVSH